jgi:hypothetical protein
MANIHIGFILCVCTGDCPGFGKMKIWDLINQVRLTLPVAWAIVHPQLCEVDGDRFFDDLLQINKNVDIKYFIAGCSPNMQKKLLGPAFQRNGLDFDEYARGIDVRNMTTDQAFELIQKELEAWGIKEDE